MLEQTHSTLYKVRFIALGIACIFMSLVIFMYLISATTNAQNTDFSDDSAITQGYDNPNFVTNGASALADRAFDATHNSLANFQNNLHGIAAHITDSTSLGSVISETSSSVGTAVLDAGQVVIHAVSSSTMVVIHSVGKGLGYTIRLPGNAIRAVTSIRFIAIIRPAATMEVPVIKPIISPKVAAAATTLPVPTPTPTVASSPPVSSATQWPIHGKITTRFGEAGSLYRGAHTGIDISDGNRSGTSPIKPFRAGKVIAVKHERYSYGNHVIIDHGGGLTSLYAHMASTSVQVGQIVDLATTLGYEGATGTATGAHLHLEIRLSNKAVNPRNYIPGLP